MKLLVGYTADERGAEAVELAAALLRPSEDAILELAIILPEQTPFQAIYPGGDHGYDTVLSAQVDRWAESALALVPDSFTGRVVAHAAPSVARGLMDLARQGEAQGIVLGGRHRHLAGFFAPGAVATSLLHASELPVALSSPAGVASLRRAGGNIERLTAFVGDKTGAAQLLGHAVQAARRLRVPLRVATLVTEREGGATDAAHLHRICDFLDELISPYGDEAQPEVVTGTDIDEAIASIGWLDGELAIFGSCRLAPPQRLFLGTKAQRMLRHLPVPMLAIPNQA